MGLREGERLRPGGANVSAQAKFSWMTDDQLASLMSRTANKLAKWRGVFAGWQLGTRLKGDPESDAVRDHREVTLLLRAEVNALTGLLIKKGVFAAREYTEQSIEEMRHLDRQYEEKFPGISTDQDGIHYKLPECAETMRGWKP